MRTGAADAIHGSPNPSCGGGGGGGKAILLGSQFDGVFVAYHIRENRWVRLEDFSYSFLLELLLESSCGSHPVAVGPTLAWVGSSYFYVYDLRYRISYAGFVRGLGNNIQYLLQNMDSALYKPALHYLEGDVFCLTWFNFPEGDTFTRLHSTMIRVPVNNPPSPFLPGYHLLDPFVVISRSYLLPYGFNYQCSLLLDGFVCGHKLI
ncbi:uncharacterized protein LOC131309400 [Rhododendron vialii]|uniref:uncharacterized protein LOC131309400 n=1 Tax=Rhododendron vialii TaxID=182163 RepID=UPI00265F9695|nr:uncharacterized protein LOC131309400 [Rhododendron vialii]